MSQKNLVQKSFKSKKILSQKVWSNKPFDWKKCWSKKFFLFQICFDLKFFIQKMFRTKSIFGPEILLGWIILGHKMFVFQRNFASTKFWVQRNSESKKFGSRKFWVYNILGPKNKSLKIIGSEKFGQNWVSNSWDIPYMDKCCLDKCHCGSWLLWKMVPGTYL